jgi:hypothetical protein
LIDFSENPAGSLTLSADRHRAMDGSGRIMSQKSNDILSKAIFGAVAVGLTFGAAQLALGRDLAGIGQPPAGTEAVINRASKADRAGVAATGAPTRTVALRLDGLPDTSVLVRIPVVEQARGGYSPVMKSGDRKTAVACEPVVSVLTEIAKQLQPGRCVT